MLSTIERNRWQVVKHNLDYDFLNRFLDNFAELSGVRRERITFSCVSLSTGTNRWGAILNKTCKEVGRMDLAKEYSDMTWVKSDKFDDLILGYLLKYKLIPEERYD